jgi:uncharacterized lipoprotein YmbA
VIKQRTGRFWAVGATIALSIALSACSQSPPVKYYALSPSPSTASGDGSELAVAIGPTEFPRALDRNQIVTRGSGAQITVDEFNVWSAPLDREFLRTLGDNIATGLGSDRIVVYPREPESKMDYRVMTDVVQFDGALGQSVLLRVRWMISRPGHGSAAVGTFESTQPVRGGDTSYDALVAAHSAAIGELSEALIAELKALGKPVK